jgi:hypothetical protein
LKMKVILWTWKSITSEIHTIRMNLTGYRNTYLLTLPKNAVKLKTIPQGY